MSNQISITGNLAADPELRYTSDGTACATLTIADTPRRRNRATGQWEDGDTLWLRCTIWRDLAENTTSSLHKGDRVTATGTLTQREWTDRQGTRRTTTEATLTSIGPDLTRATATPTRTQHHSPGQTQAPQAQAHDPWTTTPTDWDTPTTNDEPPF